jgi:hypothetical protein
LAGGSDESTDSGGLFRPGFELKLASKTQLKTFESEKWRREECVFVQSHYRSLIAIDDMLRLCWIPSPAPLTPVFAEPEHPKPGR